jgi:UTP-glucose-1-phosphate uridylyltransferase
MFLEGNQQELGNDRIEELRAILERQQGRAVTQEEASGLGESLMSFFETLGGEPPQEAEQPEAYVLGAK